MDDKTQVLLVEGSDDLHLIGNICEKYKVEETFEIEDCKGVNRLLEGLPIRLKGSGETKTLGVVVDADIDVKSRWMHLRQIMINSNLYKNVPVACPSEGLILSPVDLDSIKIGVWIMPDNSNNGMLEDFVAFLVPKADNLLPIVDSVLSDIEDRGLNKYKLCHHSKARMHTWLAWQDNPGTPIGMAITKKYLTTTPPICQTFVNWLNNLFNQDCL